MTEDQEMHEIMHAIDELVNERKWGELGIVLDMVDVTTLSVLLIVVYVRCSFRTRSVVPEWGSLYNRAYAELIIRGINAASVLRGMLPPSQQEQK